MAEPHKKPDARDTAIYANDLYAVGPHRKLKSANSLIAVPHENFNEQYPTFLSMIESEDGVQCLKKMFNAIATGAHNNGANSEIFWLINASDESMTAKNLTYSQGSYPHVHIFHGPLPENYKYGYILEEKTYTPNPRADFNEKLQEYLCESNLSTPTGKESYCLFEVPEVFSESPYPYHIHIVSPDFINFMDFTARADDIDYDLVRMSIVARMGKLVESGGARLICDDFNSPGIFTLRIQGGDQKHKWFERPQPSL